VSDSALNQVFIINLGNHSVLPFAGTGVSGTSGDGGLATDAELTDPGALAWHGGNLYIADPGSGNVRMVDGGGDISTVAGNGDVTASGDGGLATGAGIGDVTAIAFDSSGNMFLGTVTADPDLRIRRVDHLTNDISTVALTTTGGYYRDQGGAINAGFFGVNGIAFDGSDNLYFSEGGSDQIGVGGGTIRKIVGPL
jgi:hypothetical protein